MGDSRYAPGWVTVPVTLRKHVGVDVVGPVASETKRLRMLVVVLEDGARRLLLGRDASVLFGLHKRRAVEWNIPVAALRDVITAQRGEGERGVRLMTGSSKRVREKSSAAITERKNKRSTSEGASRERPRAGAKLWRSMKREAAERRAVTSCEAVCERNEGREKVKLSSSARSSSISNARERATTSEVVVQMITVRNQKGNSSTTSASSASEAGENVFAARFAGNLLDREPIPELPPPITEQKKDASCDEHDGGGTPESKSSEASEASAPTIHASVFSSSVSSAESAACSEEK